jgi:hypothetical protein
MAHPSARLTPLGRRLLVEGAAVRGWSLLPVVNEDELHPVRPGSILGATPRSGLPAWVGRRNIRETSDIIAAVTTTPNRTTFTDFLRNPNEVADLAREGDVILRRRGSEDLRLTVAARATADREGLGAVSRIIAALLDDPVVRKRIGRQVALPWLRFLPPAERARFYADLFACVEGASQIGSYAPVGRLLDEWQATAAVYADPDLAARLQRPLPGDGGEVVRPGDE